MSRNRHTRPKQVPVVSFIHIRSMMDPTSPIMSVHSHARPCPLWLSQAIRTTTRPPHVSSSRDLNKSFSAKLNSAFLETLPAVYTGKPSTVCSVCQNSMVSVLLSFLITSTPFQVGLCGSRCRCVVLVYRSVGSQHRPTRRQESLTGCYTWADIIESLYGQRSDCHQTPTQLSRPTS